MGRGEAMALALALALELLRAQPAVFGKRHTVSIGGGIGKELAKMLPQVESRGLYFFCLLLHRNGKK